MTNSSHCEHNDCSGSDRSEHDESVFGLMRLPQKQLETLSSQSGQTENIDGER